MRPVPESWIRPLVIAHVAATLFMVGLIWTIHVVHYPLFAEVGAENYVDYQSAHVERIGIVLAFPWLLEGLTLLGVMALAVERRELRVPALVGAVAMAVVLVISVTPGPGAGRKVTATISEILPFLGNEVISVVNAATIHEKLDVNDTIVDEELASALRAGLAAFS